MNSVVSMPPLVSKFGPVFLFLTVFLLMLIFICIVLWKKRRRLAIFCTCLITIIVSLKAIILYRITQHTLIHAPPENREFFFPLPIVLFDIFISAIGIVVSLYIKNIQNMREDELKNSILQLQSLNRLKEEYNTQLQVEVESKTVTLKQSNDMLVAQTKQLRALDDAKSRFFSSISHEFRTPLTLIFGPIEDVLSQRFGAINTKMSQAMRTAKNQAQNLLELVDELLDIARLDAGAMKLNAQQVNLTSFIGTIVDQFESLADSRLVSLEKLLPDYACLVVVDQKQFRKVIINLINNGIKFTPEIGKVIVELSKQNDFFMVSVRDTGCGVKSDELNSIFDRFHQVDKTGNKSGVGLGLPLAREITELHNGTLSATSEEGIGSCFTIKLPIDTELEVGGTQVIESPQIIRQNSPNLTDNDIPCIDSSTTVLIVEDNVELRRYLCNHLKPNYSILESKNGETGYATACKHLPDLIISDIMMPVMDGITLCQKLKANTETKFIPVILLTALTEDTHQIEGFKAQADDYLPKPFNSEILEARVGNLILSRRNMLERSSDSPDIFPKAKGLVNREENFATQLQNSIKEGLSNSSFSVEELASALAMERSTLTRKTKKVFDASPGELIKKARLNWAKSLLEKEEGSISDIAYTVGFANLAHFSHAFKNHFNATPSKFREFFISEKILP